MSRLRDENVTKCVSLLREFIDEASVKGDKKGGAILALNQLHRITAGTELPAPSGGDPAALGAGCNGIPRIDYNPVP